jgi:hypothetical protein
MRDPKGQEARMRQWIMALALLVSLAPAARAGGIHARIEGPDRDGLTYTARTLSCNENDALEPWAYAEGRVDGKRKSALIRLEPTSEHGVYRFARTWPREGRWMIRLSLGHPPAPATVATLRADGTVRSNKLYLKSDGSRECSKALHLKSDEDC